MLRVSPNYIRRYLDPNIIKHISYPGYAGYYNISWIHNPSCAHIARACRVRNVCADDAHVPNASIGPLAHELGQLWLGFSTDSIRGSGP